MIKKTAATSIFLLFLLMICCKSHNHNLKCYGEITGIVVDVKSKKGSGCDCIGSKGQVKFFFKDGRILTLRGLDKNVSYSIKVGRKYRIAYCKKMRVVTLIRLIEDK